MENTKINFMAFKSFGFAFSSVLAVGSIIVLLTGVNLGIDFKGGTAVGVSFSEEISIQEVRTSLKSVSVDNKVYDLSSEEIKYFGDKEIIGEITVVVKGIKRENINIDKLTIKKDLNYLINAGLSLSAASKYLAKKNGMKKSEIYNMI